MVLRQVLNLDQPASIPPCAVGTIELNETSGSTVRAHYSLHGRVFLYAALGQFLSHRQCKFHLSVCLLQHLQDGSLRQGLRFHATLGQPLFELGWAVGVLQPGNGAGLLHVGALELIIAGNGLSHHRHVQHDSTVVDLLVKVVITPFGLSYWEF